MIGCDPARGSLDRRALRVLAMLAVLHGIAACSSPPPTWHQDIAPLLADRCMPCHRTGGLAPFALTDYDSVREKAHIMVDQIERGAMPPFSARSDDDCAPRFNWVGDPRLSASEQAMLQQWMSDGYLLGDPAPPPPIADRDLARVSTTLVPEQGWMASGERDQFICYVFDVGNPELAWLTGLQIQPGQATIVHHALIYVMGPDAGAPLVARHGLGQPFICNDEVSGSSQVHAWFPGNQPLQLPAGMAMPLLPDTKIAIQIHYHPHGGTYELDRTTLDLQFSPTRPAQLYFTASLGNEVGPPTLLPGPGDSDEGTPEFVVPRNSPDHTEHMRIPVPFFDHDPNVRLVSVLPHMHFIGTGLAIRLERRRARGGNPRTECLSNTGWNFDWQRTYAYDAPFDRLPSIAGGDIVDIQCTWDNTLANPFVQRLLTDTNTGLPFDIRFGEQTSNEMCLANLGLAYPTPRDLSARSVAALLARAASSLHREPPPDTAPP